MRKRLASLLVLFGCAGIASAQLSRDVVLTSADCLGITCGQSISNFSCTFGDPIPQAFYRGYKIKRFVITRKMAHLPLYQAATVTARINGTRIGDPVTVANQGFCSFGSSDTVTTDYVFDTGVLTSGLEGYSYGGINTVSFTTDQPIEFKQSAWTITITPGDPSYQVQLEISTNPAAPFTVEKGVADGGSAIADLSLGTVFRVKLAKRDTSSGATTVTPVQAIYSRTNDQISPSFETEGNLFDRGTLVPLGASSDDQTYIAVHMGSVDFSIVPLVTNAKPLRLHVNIVPPPSLGSTNNDLDGEIIAAAHERGIPPQILKGQVRQESPRFSRKEFRYEPCTTDLAVMSSGPTLIQQPPYSLFALDAALDDPAVAPVADLRNALHRMDANGAVVAITHADRGVTAADIWRGSDGYPHNSQNWSKLDCAPLKAYLKQGRSVDEFVTNELDFVAQTVTSSSYGLLQILYPTAVQYRWSVIDPTTGQSTQNPRYLLDTPEALALPHGGSLFVGGAEDVQRYWDENDPLPVSFKSRADFFDSFTKPLRMYTGGGISDYGTNVVDIYQYLYLPSQRPLVFH